MFWRYLLGWCDDPYVEILKVNKRTSKEDPSPQLPVVLDVRLSYWFKVRVTRSWAKVRSHSESKNTGKGTGPHEACKLDKENA